MADRSRTTEFISSCQQAGQWLLYLEALPIIIAMVVLFISFGLYTPRFLRAANLINVIRNSSYLTIISCGQMLVLVIGGFDLSVGAVVALASVVSASCMVGITSAMPDQVVLAIGVGTGAALVSGLAVGFVNGLCVVLLGVSPFIVTLGTMSIVEGIVFYWTQGVPIYGMPDVFTHALGRLRWLNLPLTIYLTVAILAVIWWIMNWTKVGRYIYAIGGNVQAVRVSGIRINFHTVIAYALCGFLAALTGVLLTARVGSGEGTLGGTLTFESITAAVLGGVAIGGGFGRVEFVALGAVFLSLVTNGMNIMRVDSKIQLIVVGALLILAIALDRLRRQERD